MWKGIVNILIKLTMNQNSDFMENSHKSIKKNDSLRNQGKGGKQQSKLEEIQWAVNRHSIKLAARARNQTLRHHFPLNLMETLRKKQEMAKMHISKKLGVNKLVQLQKKKKGRRERKRREKRKKGRLPA